MSCIVCKKLWVPGCARSFHKFPKDLQRKQKWMEIIGISKVTSNSTVCSDHFTPESYHRTDEFTIIKRLLSTAEPVINTNIKVLSDVTNEAITANNKSSNSTECMTIIDSDKKSNKIVNSILIKSINEIETNIDEKSVSINEEGRLTRLHSLDNLVNGTPTKKMCLVSNALNVKLLENINQVESNMSRKRKSLGNGQESYPNKRFRFMDGYTFKTISRGDFKTDKGWDTFMRFVAIQRNKNAVNRRKMLRNKNKIKSFKDLINNLKEKETEAAAKYLEGLPETMKQLLTRMKERKRTAPFPSTLKNFARSIVYL